MATATWQVTNTSITGTITRQYNQNQAGVPTTFNGTINGNQVSVSESSNAICNGIARTYRTQYQGTLSGNTLTLMSSDTLCPVEGCIFQKTFRLTR